MKRKFAIPVALACLSCFGVLGVEALPVCERIVKSYKTTRTPNKVSPLTAARWALWNKEHPDFKPHARPKYKLATKEVVDKVQFACETMPHIPNDEIALLPPLPITDVLPDDPVYFSPDYVPGITEVASNNTPVLPFVPPYAPAGGPVLPTPVPEPSDLALIVTGLAGVFALRYRYATQPR